MLTSYLVEKLINTLLISICDYDELYSRQSLIAMKFEGVRLQLLDPR